MSLVFSANGKSLPIDNSTPFFLSSRGTKLADVLRDLGANYQLPVVVSKKIEGTFIGTIDSVNLSDAMNKLAQLYQLAWFYDGQALYIYLAQEVESRLLTPDYLRPATLIKQLNSVELLDPRQCRIKAVAASNAIEVYGVPVCVERVELFAKRLDTQAINREQNQEVVKLYPLKYATAADSQYSYRSQQVIIPGVVSLLREMSEGRSLPLASEQSKPQSTERQLPMFSADVRQNAVVVRDKRANLGLYENLIKQLDHRPKLVEVSVTIIDISAEVLGQLGIDWSGSVNFGGSGVTFNSNTGLSDSNFSTVIPNIGNFMLRVSALEKNARAQVISRPSLLTLDNMQAILDRNVTFYTKINSARDARLESISTGSLLRITPRIVEENKKQAVMLSLVVQDGKQTPALSEQEPLPQTSNAEIVTHTLLNKSEALLLGGFIQDQNSEGVTKIPLLGDIPILGALFRSKQNRATQTVRMFMITASSKQ